MKNRMIDIYVEETGDNAISVSCEVHWRKSYDMLVQAFKGILNSLEKCEKAALADAVEQIIAEESEDDDNE